ncbi:MAG: ABC transporter permease, partial [Chloroflexaceae bacterium]|nr:ABC transporter permease [Chloroflexaceae bacterium]
MQPLQRRLRAIGLPPAAIASHIAAAVAAPDWKALATLDAATRMVAALQRAGAVRHAAEAARVLAHLVAHAEPPLPERNDQTLPLIPSAYWLVRPLPPDEDTPDEVLLLLRGAVLVRVQGKHPPLTEPTPDDTPVAPELLAALSAPPERPLRMLLHLLREDGLLTPLVLLAAMLLAAGGVVVEALLLRGLLDLGGVLNLATERFGALALLIVFLLALLLLELPLVAGLLRSGRRLEARLRMAFLAKLPRLNDRYFQSRLISDMAERSHMVHLIRIAPT